MTCLPQGLYTCSVPCLEAFALGLGLGGSSSALVSVQAYLLREAFILATLLYTLRTLASIQHDPIMFVHGFSCFLPAPHIGLAVPGGQSYLSWPLLSLT